MAKATKKAIKPEVQPAIITTVNPPKGKVARTSVTSEPAKAQPGVVTPPALTAEQEKEWKRLDAIRRASSTAVGRSRYGANVYRLKGNPEMAAKLPPQARVILKVMDDAKVTKMTYNELIAAMKKVWDNERYRQGPERIVQFYRSRLQEGGHAEFKD
jgi:hypothetical protein